MDDSTLVLLKEKIINTNSVIKLLSEKNEKINQLRAKLKFLYHKYLERTKEVEICKLEHKPLTIDYKNLSEKYSKLEEDYKNVVNKSEIKYQRICRELEESLSKSDEANKSDKCEKCRERLEKSRVLKREIISLKQQVKRLSAQNSIIVPKTDPDFKELKRRHAIEIENFKADHKLQQESIKTKLKIEINYYQNKLISSEAHELLLKEKIKDLTLRLDDANQRLSKKVDEKVTEGTLFHLLSECAVPEIPNAISKNDSLDKIDNICNEHQSPISKDIDDIFDCQNNLSDDEDFFGFDNVNLPAISPSEIIRDEINESDPERKVSENLTECKPEKSNKINIIKQVILKPAFCSTPKNDPVSNEPSHHALNSFQHLQSENVEITKSDESETLYFEDQVDIWKCIQEMKDYPQLLSPFSSYDDDEAKPNDDCKNQNNSSKANEIKAIDEANVDCKTQNNSLKSVDIDTRLITKRCAQRRRKTLINGIKKDLFQSIVKYINSLVRKEKRNPISSKGGVKTKRMSHKFRAMRKLQMLRWKELRELWLSNTDSEQDTCRTHIKKIRRKKYREKLEKEYLENKERYGKLSANFQSITEFYNSLSSGENIKLNLNESVVGCDTPDESCLSSLDSGFGRSDNENKLVNKVKVVEIEQCVQKSKIDKNEYKKNDAMDNEKACYKSNIGFSEESNKIDRRTIENMATTNREEKQIEQIANIIIDPNLSAIDESTCATEDSFMDNPPSIKSNESHLIKKYDDPLEMIKRNEESKSPDFKLFQSEQSIFTGQKQSNTIIPEAVEDPIKTAGKNNEDLNDIPNLKDKPSGTDNSKICGGYKNQDLKFTTNNVENKIIVEAEMKDCTKEDRIGETEDTRGISSEHQETVKEAMNRKMIEGKGKKGNDQNTENERKQLTDKYLNDDSISGTKTFVTNEIGSGETYQVVEKAHNKNDQLIKHKECKEELFLAEKQTKSIAAVEIKQHAKKSKVEEVENTGGDFSKKGNNERYEKTFDNTGKLDANEKQKGKPNNFIVEPIEKTNQTSAEINENVSTQLTDFRSIIKVEDKNEIYNKEQHVIHGMYPEKLFIAKKQHEQGYKENCELIEGENKTAEEVRNFQIEEKQGHKCCVSTQQTSQIVQRTTSCIDQCGIDLQDNNISYSQDESKTLPTESFEKVNSFSSHSFHNLRRSKRYKSGESKIKNLSTEIVENEVQQRTNKSLSDEILGLIAEDGEFSKCHNVGPSSEIVEESYGTSAKSNRRKAHCPKQCIDTAEKKRQLSLSTITTRSKRKLRNNTAEKSNKDDDNSEVEGNIYEKIGPSAKKAKLENYQHNGSVDIEAIKSKIIIEVESTKKPEKTTFKRPNRRKIQLESPMSPPHVTDCDDLPTVSKIIPLEPIGELHEGTAKRLLKKLIQFPDESTILQEVFEKFSDQKQEYIIRLILEEIALDKSTPDTLYTPPAPVMTVVQRVLLGFLARLQETFPYLLEDILPAIEHWILTQATLQSIQPITRLYIAVCKLQKVKHRMRRMVCDVFYSLEDLAVPFLFTVLGTWTDILPLETESTDNPLVKVLMQVINMKTCTQPGYNLIPLKKLLEAYYGYPTERWNSEEVFKDIFESFKRTPTKYIEYCLLILCKNHPKKWVCQQITNHVKPTLGTACKSTLQNPTFLLLQNILPMLAGDNSTCVQELKSWLQELSP